MRWRIQLQETILAEGLEDLIPLPEIAMTVRHRELVDTEQDTVAELSRALLTLLREERIQVWRGHWSVEPEVVKPETAEVLLVVEQQYEFNSPADLEQRVYYVNVDNLRVDDDGA